MNDQELRAKLLKACSLFYQTFDFYPDEIGVHRTRKVGLYVTCACLTEEAKKALATLDLPSADDVKIQKVTIPVRAYLSLGHDDFVLYAGKTGLIRHGDLLEPEAELIRTMIEAKGFNAVMFLGDTYDNVTITKNGKSIVWSIPLSMYRQDIFTIKTTIDYKLRQFEEVVEKR